MSVTCTLCSVIVLMAAGSGGIPVTCKQDICLEGFINKTFHRLHIKCAELFRNLWMDCKDFLENDVSFIPGTGCVTWRSGSLSLCYVTEIHHSGKQTNVALTYNCTRASDPLTTGALEPDGPALTTPSTAPSANNCKGHIIAVVFIIASVFGLGLVFICFSKVFQLFLVMLHKSPGNLGDQSRR